MMKHLVGLITLSSAVAIATGGTVFGQKANIYRNVIEKEVEVFTEALNIRTGPGLDYPVVGTVERGEVLDVIGTLDDWYIVLLPDNSIGVISSKYTKVYTMGEVVVVQGSDDSEMDSEETEAEALFRLSNISRAENGLPLFEWDEKINRIAQLKAEDMVNNQYFDHDSPKYGTPFTMLKQMGIIYKGASENIARNNSIENAHLEIMASIYHRVNVLNSRYNKMGIGIMDSPDWGKMIVQIFVEE